MSHSPTNTTGTTGNSVTRAAQLPGPIASTSAVTSADEELSELTDEELFPRACFEDSSTSAAKSSTSVTAHFDSLHSFETEGILDEEDSCFKKLLISFSEDASAAAAKSATCAASFLTQAAAASAVAAAALKAAGQRRDRDRE